MSESASNWSSKEIIKYIESLIDEVKNVPTELRRSAKFEVSIIKKHKTFYDTFKMLTKKILYDGGNFNLDEMKKLLRMREEVDSGRITKESANKKIGQEYYDRYAAPVVAGLDTKDSKSDN